MNFLTRGIAQLVLLSMAMACTTPDSDTVTPSGPSVSDKVPAVTITTFAGTDTREGFADGKGKAAQFRYPCQMAIDKYDNLYVVDQLYSYYGGSIIRKVDPQGNVTTFVRGLGSVTDICVDPRDGLTLYAIECGDARGFDNGILRISSGGQVTRLSGGPDANGGNSFGFRDGPLSQAKFNKPSGIAMDNAGNLYIADELNRLVRKVNLTAKTVTTLAGAYEPDNASCDFADGKGAAAKFCSVNNLTLDDAGNVYVPDWNNNTIRKITPDGTVSSYIRSGPGFNKDCPISQAKVWYPSCVRYDANSHQMLFADHSGETLCLVTPNNTVFSLSHHVLSTDYADHSPGSQHTFDAMVMNKQGDVLILDKNNHCIRKLNISWQ